MKLTIGGKTYHTKSLRLYELTLGEARELKRLTGLTIGDWRLGLLTWDRHDPDVLAGTVWLLKTRAGDPVDWPALHTIPTPELLQGFDWADDLAELQDTVAKLTQPAESPTEPTDSDE